MFGTVVSPGSRHTVERVSGKGGELVSSPMQSRANEPTTGSGVHSMELGAVVESGRFDSLVKSPASGRNRRSVLKGLLGFVARDDFGTVCVAMCQTAGRTPRNMGVRFMKGAPMLKRLLFGFLICFTLGALGVIPSVAAQDGTPSPVASGPTPVIIDSDMISDDWMATLYVLNDPQF